MSSEAVAQYLYQVGSNERKLEYCRQLLASNTNFIPECVFNLNNAMSTNTQPKSQFIGNIRSLGLGCSEQEQNLIFNYFQLDGKNYITFGQYSDLLLPQSDPAVKKIINMRKKQQFTLDYSLRYSLQKFFFQVIANQVRLQLFCKFTFPKNIKDDKFKGKRLDPTMLCDFMKAHGKYPDSKFSQLIVRQMNLNKGDCKRHKLIIEYINQFNQTIKKGEKPPEVYQKQPVVISLTKKDTGKENKNINSIKLQRNEFSSSKVNPISRVSNINTGKLSVSAIMPADGYKGPNLQNITSVQKRISELMSEVKVRKIGQIKDSSSPSPIKEMMMRKQSLFSKPMNTSSVVESVKKQLRQQKIDRAVAESKISIPQKQYSFEIKDKKNEQKYHTDRDQKQKNFDYEAVTSKGKTDRDFGIKSKLNESQFGRGSDISSQIIFKPKSHVKSYIKEDISAIAEKGDPYQNRIKYLKGLLAKNP